MVVERPELESLRAIASRRLAQVMSSFRGEVPSYLQTLHLADEIMSTRRRRSGTLRSRTPALERLEVVRIGQRSPLCCTKIFVAHLACHWKVRIQTVLSVAESLSPPRKIATHVACGSLAKSDMDAMVS